MRENTAIPIPEVLDWSNDPNNAIGTEYIIMRRATGVHLQDRWETMSCLEHLQCVESLARLMKQTVDLRFPAYGSLYFANTHVDSAPLVQFGNGYAIGPHCGQVYWAVAAGSVRNHDRVQPNRGPCMSVVTDSFAS